MKLNCKDMCEGWMWLYSGGYIPGATYIWTHCHYCGAQLIDKDAELKHEIVDLWKNNQLYIDFIGELFDRYNITKREKSDEN